MPTDLMPSQGFSSMASQLGSLWGRQSRGRQLVAVLLLLGVGAGFAYVMLLDGPPRWATVVTAHRDAEARECVAVLQRAGVSVRANGRDIDVPPEQLEVARRALAAEGLPDAGAGLKSFAEPSFMSSSFAEQVSYKRALQEDLERSIKGLAPVESARVHLAMGRRSLFKEREQRPSASVVLRLRPEQPLDGQAVRGIRQLVVGSVEGMAVEDVAVIDHLGNLLDGEAALASDERTEIEEAVSGKVRGLLERVVGMGNAVVVASAELELRGGEDAQPPRAEDASATPAAPAAPASVASVAAPASAPPSRGGEARAVSRLRRLQVAVVVNYRRGADGVAVAPSADELARWTQLVRSAAGIDDTRGDRVELQAAALEPLVPAALVRGAAGETGAPGAPGAWGSMPSPRQLAAGAALALLAALLAQMWMRRRYARQLEAAQAQAQELERKAVVSERRAAEATQAAHALQAMQRAAATLSGERAEELRPAGERTGEAVRRDLDGAAIVLAAWLGERQERAAERELAKEALS